MSFEPATFIQQLKGVLDAAGLAPRQWMISLVAAGLLLWGALQLIVKLRSLAADLLPQRFRRDSRLRLLRRHRFAEYLESELRRINGDQIWSDSRFAGLEAEVEVIGHRWRMALWRPRYGGRLRRERSLSRALYRSHERLVLLEGDPGSGKSVALRHVAQGLVRRAQRGGLKRVIPIYVNLRELSRSSDQPIDLNLIRKFVLDVLNRPNDREIVTYLDEEFDRGLQDGTWLFLFDSFDEIADVLGTREGESFARAYAQAISDFLHGLNRSRGIVASRRFRSWTAAEWPRFRVLPLSPARRRELVRKAELERQEEGMLLGSLPVAEERFGALASNPLFLTLLVEHMRSAQPFPETIHAVFESYIVQRLRRDQERLRARFALDAGTIRTSAERIAFCMAADAELGLSPSRARLAEALRRRSFSVHCLASVLDSLEFLALAQSESGGQPGSSERLFTFAHRRLQEYFATCLVLREPHLVSGHDLLFDGHWRETAIVVCQTSAAEQLAPLLDQMALCIEQQGLLGKIGGALASLGGPAGDLEAAEPAPGFLHVLGILQEGFAGRPHDLPQGLREKAGHALRSLFASTGLLDRKWALEVAGSVDEASLIWMLRDAFSGRSQWLADVAYRQVARLRTIPEDIAAGIRQALMRLYSQGLLDRDRDTTDAFLSRLQRPERFLRVHRLLRSVRVLDAGLLAALGLYLVGTAENRGVSGSRALLLILVLFASYVALPLANRIVSTSWLAEFFGAKDEEEDDNDHVDAVPPRREERLATSSRGYMVAILVAAARAEMISLAWPLPAMAQLWVLYCTFWGPMACATALSGSFVRVGWWPFIPVLPLVEILKADLKVARTTTLKEWGAVLGGLAGLVGLWWFVRREVSKQGDSWRWLRSFPVERLLLLLAFSIGWILLLVLWRWALDQRLLHRFRQKASRDLDQGFFVAATLQFRQNRSRVRWLRWIRSEGLLRADVDGAVHLLKALIVYLERGGAPYIFSLEDRRSPFLDEMAAMLRIDRGAEVERRKALVAGRFERSGVWRGWNMPSPWSAEALDELSILFENLKRAGDTSAQAAQRQSSPGMGGPEALGQGPAGLDRGR